MTSDKKTAEPALERETKSSRASTIPATGQEPDWANGLRQLYDSVVDEPLPDSFKDLLSQLDGKSKSS